jgi:phosphoadenosine phosphosulfate reductase
LRQSAAGGLAAAVERYAPKIVLACSFGAEDVVLVDMVHRINPSVPLFYLDTDFLFPETYATRDRAIERYRLQPQQVIQVKSLLTPDEQAAQLATPCGRAIPTNIASCAKWSRSRELKGFDAWITGTADRSHESQCKADRMGPEISVGQSQSPREVDLGGCLDLHSCP